MPAILYYTRISVPSLPRQLHQIYSILFAADSSEINGQCDAHGTLTTHVPFSLSVSECRCSPIQNRQGHAVHVRLANRCNDLYWPPPTLFAANRSWQVNLALN
jgi:hypothetical protein